MGTSTGGVTVIGLGPMGRAMVRAFLAADWLADQGAVFVAGGVLAWAEIVGTDGASVLYSGSRQAFDAHEETLAVLGRPEYLGTDHGLAQLYYQAELQVFLTTLAAYLQSFAMFTAAGIPAQEFLSRAAPAADVAVFLPAAARAVDEGRYPGELATCS